MAGLDPWRRLAQVDFAAIERRVLAHMEANYFIKECQLCIGQDREHGCYCAAQGITPEELAAGGPQQKESTSMNKSILIFLVPNSVTRMVRACYEFDADGRPREGKTYCFKTNDDTIKVGDVCIVPSKLETRGVGFATVKITEVNVEPDYDSMVEYVWIAGKLDRQGYDNLLADEQKLIDLANRAEKQAKKEALFKKVTDFVSAEALQAALPAPSKPADIGDE